MKLFHRTVRLLPDNSKFKRQHFSLAHAERSAYIFTVRNVVAARLCCHRRLSFCSQGVCVRVCVWQIRPWADTFHRQTPSIGRHSPLGRHPPGQTPWADTPGKTVLVRHPPTRWLLQRNRTAFYWNAFLYETSFRVLFSWSLSELKLVLNFVSFIVW